MVIVHALPEEIKVKLAGRLETLFLSKPVAEVFSALEKDYVLTAQIYFLDQERGIRRYNTLMFRNLSW